MPVLVFLAVAVIVMMAVAVIVIMPVRVLVAVSGLAATFAHLVRLLLWMH
jgi:hypothetical protein